MKFDNRKSYSAGSGKNECASPPFSVEPLIQSLDRFNRLFNLSDDRSDMVLWEPAIGSEGQHTGLVEGLLSVGYTVIASGDDFLAYDKPPDGRIQGIITNPPYDSTTKQAFIKKCEYFRLEHEIFWALLISPLTLFETRIYSEMSGCSIHRPLGRISFGMPDKGWGTEEHPTTPTFATTWISKGIYAKATITDSSFKQGPHYFAALPRWLDYLFELHNKGEDNG